MVSERARCECLVRRLDYGWSTEDPAERREPCGRLAKTLVRVGQRDIPACWVHAKVLSRKLGLS